MVTRQVGETTDALGLNRRVIALMTIKARLQLEIKVPGWRGGSTGRHTMKAARGWGFAGRSRLEALNWVLGELAKIEEGADVHE